MKKINRIEAPRADKPSLKRVAAYARVSMETERLNHSLSAQISRYSELIQKHPGWQYAGVYADNGISGTSTKHREGFKHMVADALAGKIDLIVTKSVSRFARNTVDSLTTIRQLKEHGTECYFEKENIWTFDSKGELLITIMSSLAQEESRSISENCTWGQRKRKSDGKVIWQCNHKYGDERCSTPHLTEEEIKAAFVTAANKAIADKDTVIETFRFIRDTVFDTSALEREREKLTDELNVVAGLIQDGIRQNAHVARDQSDYNREYESLTERYENAKSRLDEVEAEIHDKNSRRKSIEHYLAILEEHKDIITEYDALLWHGMVEFATVYGKDDIRFTMKDGMEIKA